VAALHLVTFNDTRLASELTERLVPAVASAITVEDLYREGAFEGAAVEVPTLVVHDVPGPTSNFPNYVFTIMTLGLIPTVTDDELEHSATLYLPGQSRVTFRWRREESLFMWLPALPLTPFWGLWRLTPPGARPWPRRLMLEELPAPVKRALQAD